MQVSTVFDLGTSRLFGNASQLAGVDRGHAGVIVGFTHALEHKIGIHANIPGEISKSEITILRGIDSALIPALESDLGIKTVGDMARWAPYTAARLILSEAFVGLTAEDPAGLALNPYEGPGTERAVTELLGSLPASASLQPEPAFPAPTQDLSSWKDLINLLPDANVMQAIRRRSVQLQQIGSAGDGSPVTLDYYPVQIRSLPSGYTMDALFDEIRRDLTTDIKPSVGDFRYWSSVDAARNTPPKYSTSGSEDQTLWLSASPEGTLFSIFIPLITGLLSSVSPTTDGTVVCSQSRPDHWVLSTCASYIDGTHPVAGNREFGYWDDPDLGQVVYTRGADRPYLPMWTTLIGTILGPLEPLPDDLLPLIFATAFRGADAFWTDFQQQVAKMAVSKGCSAKVVAPVVGHYDWDSVFAKYGATSA
ncbi:MAG: hypothetical protein OK442_00260 [Thaumarchaeota archaeon]|nr:hypothetical protein [Nitrososphaerota archaeon]